MTCYSQYRQSAPSSAILVSLLLSLGGCQSSRTEPTVGAGTSSKLSLSASTSPDPLSQPFQAFLEKSFQEELNLSPERKSWLGLKDNQNQLDDASPEQQERYFELAKKQLEALRSFSRDKLSEDDRLNYDLFALKLEQKLNAYPYRYHNYPVNQMFGIQSELPSFMINVHRVTSEKDLRDYIDRLRQFKRKFAQMEEGLKIQAEKGVILPKFLFPHVLRDCSNIVSGAPFAKSPQAKSPLYEDFTKKLVALQLPREKVMLYDAEAQEALLNSVAPAYASLSATLKELEKKAPLQGGAGSLPQGAAFYQYALMDENSTPLTAEEVHQIGLREVARIQGEMRAIVQKIGFKGDLQAFFKSVRKDEKFYYPNSAKGRQDYLNDTAKILDTMQGRLPEFFTQVPPQKLEVKQVEAYREASAGAAFYSQPSEDGQRPGIYYVNLHEMRQVPRYEMEALAYHEGVPGHHLQLSASQNLKELPRFRRFGDQTAFIEGWGLYAEKFPKGAGFYQDPYSDFGRLSMELWRAARLVVDTGLHGKAWTREEAIKYLATQTPADASEISNSVERYLVMPGQATAYMLGMLKIVELRDRIVQAQGSNFDLRKFHDEVLKRGPLPLSILDKEVSESFGLQQSATGLQAEAPQTKPAGGA